MAALTGPRVALVGRGTVKKTTFPLKAGATAWDGGVACIDTANPGSVVPADGVTTTLKPIGTFTTSVNNSAGSGIAMVGVELFREREVYYYDSVTGAGAVTESNLFSDLYLASDHEVTTVATGSPAGFAWRIVHPGGYIAVEAPFS
jgi:hypothetical protein